MPPADVDPDVRERLDVLRDLGCRIEGPRRVEPLPGLGPPGEVEEVCAIVLPTGEVIEAEGPTPSEAAATAAERAEEEMGVRTYPGVDDPGLIARLEHLSAHGVRAVTRLDENGRGPVCRLVRGERLVAVYAGPLRVAVAQAIEAWERLAPVHAPD